MNRNNYGSISIYVLVLGVVFSMVIGTVVMYSGIEHNNVNRSQAYSAALGVAEAGAYYYRWHLAHDPRDFTDGTGASGPYLKEFHDPEGGLLGYYSLDITPPEEGSERVEIISTGWVAQYPRIKRSVRVVFGPEPLTNFSFLHNANVWFGQGLSVYGEVFSNGGIRMDGINESTVKSAQLNYTCGSETGCSPARTRPGVWGDGGPTALWEFPVPIFDFDSVVTDFNQMRTAAQTYGRYYPYSRAWGYQIVFQPNGTFDVYRVTSTGSINGWSVEDDCQSLRQIINNRQFLGNYSVENNKIIYFEDTVWVEGTVNGKTTVVAARLPVGTYSTNMWLKDSIEYADHDGSDNLGLIAQNNIYFVRNLPNNTVINAALMAQQGRIIRHHYNDYGCSSSSYAIRNSLSIIGSVISNQKSYWNYNNYFGLRSGFNERSITYNQQAAEEPPPYFPSTDTYRILSWEEIETP